MSNSKRTACATCPGGECLVGPYEEIAKECNKKGGQAHHVPPDWSVRQGTRPDYQGSKKTTDRIFGKRADGKGKKRMPSLNKGPCICLEGKKSDDSSRHGIAHECDDLIQKTKLNGIPDNTIPLKMVLFYAKKTAGLAAPECKKEINDAVDKVYEDYDKKSLVRNKEKPRTKKGVPRFNPEAITAWKRGTTFP